MVNQNKRGLNKTKKQCQYPREVLEHYRFRAIELHKKGKKVNDIADFLGVHRGSVSRWITICKRQGKKGIKRRKAKGSAPKLNPKEIRRIIKFLRDDATEHGFDTPLWTCKRVRQIIAKEIGKQLAISNVWKWLTRWGLTNQKPERRALEADPEAVEKWLKEDWPKIRAHAKRWQAMLYFLDEAGVSLTAVMGKTWAPKGKTPVVKTTGKRGGFCVSSAISPAGRMVFRIEKERVTAKVFIGFLKQIIRHHKNRKVIIICDKAPAHRANAVKQFAEGHKNRFNIYFLPSYSPQLNPDERVWKSLKCDKLRAHQAKTKEELRPLILSKMWSIQRTPMLTQSFFNDSYVTQ